MANVAEKLWFEMAPPDVAPVAATARWDPAQFAAAVDIVLDA